jgi:hypothetical protein
MSRVRAGPPPPAPEDGASARASRLLIAAIVAGALAVVALVVVQNHPRPAPVAEQVTAAYVAAWNHRDAQAVSDLTCLWPPAFTPVGVIEDQFSSDPAGAPSIGEYSVVGTEQATMSDREVVAVRVDYVRAGEGRTRRATVYVRLDDTQDPCLAALTTW